MRIEMRRGHQVQRLIDSFYEAHGSRGRSRPDDLFFLAMNDETLIGCVRYCVENDTPMLRTMMVHQHHRRQGVGRALLGRFAEYLDIHGIRDVYCLPYSHLEDFYGSAGFIQVPLSRVPAFLQHRLRVYDPTGTHYLCMRRP